MSHPNHEFAIYGFVQRLRPHFIYLTDGGSETRVSETREALARIGLLDNVTFLGHPEQTFYQRLLDVDIGYFHAIAAEVKHVADNLQPEQVFCDRVEHYNPVHDPALPIVKQALKDQPQVETREVPLTVQTCKEPQRYEIQRVPPVDPVRRFALELTSEELTAKLEVMTTVYKSLRDQLGHLLSGLTAKHFAHEEVTLARSDLSQPDANTVLRYEWRARLLQTQGKVEEIITFKKHYLPIARGLFG